MKVLIVSVFPPDPAPEANHALHIALELARVGHEIHVLCQQGSIAPDREKIVMHPSIRDWSWSDLLRIVQCLRDSRPDVVLLIYIGWTYTHHPMITFLPTVCQMMRVPCVTQFEAIETSFPNRSLTTRVTRKAMAVWAGGPQVDWQFGTLLRDSTRVIVLSSPHKNRLQQHFADLDDKTTIVPPPPLIRICEEDRQTVRMRIRRLIGASHDDFVVLYWGYLYPGKGVETLLRAFRLLAKKDSSVRLVLVGGTLEIAGLAQNCTSYCEMLRRLPGELGIEDRVVWTGQFNWDEDTGSQYLYGGDVCVLPFDFGVTLNNSSLAAASTHGIPVIATELAKGRDESLEHGRNIYLCRPRDPEMLAEAIRIVCEDATLRNRLRNGALSLAGTWYRWDRTAARLVGVLTSAVSCFRGNTYQTAPSRQDAADEQSAGCSGSVPLSSDQDRKRFQEQPSLDAREEHTPPVTIPLVSVIVAVHNVDRYLCQCLDALVHQTLRNIEIIVVNDASTDGSAEIITQYKSSYPHLKVITCDSNRGLASTRNIGLRAATGQYVAFADGDDWVDISMCEVLYRRASEENADVVIADAIVFYDDAKRFGHFFDQHIRKKLDPRFRTLPFGVHTEPRVLLLEPVAWTKLYDRKFLQTHGIQFEEGMNSYEDICFHVSVLLKAKRILLLDDKLFFYRQNRPGQISGRTNRKIFEVFSVFQRIHENVAAWHTDADIWALLIQVQLRQFNWLLKDRVQANHKREFLALAANQLRSLPHEGARKFLARANMYDLTTFLCMRGQWVSTYERVAKNHWSWAFLWAAVQRDGLAAAVRQSPQFLRGVLSRVLNGVIRRIMVKARHIDSWDILQESSHVGKADDRTAIQAESVVEVCRFDHDVLFLSHPHDCPIGSPMWRMEPDYYLHRTVVFREGDIIVDVGAYVGEFALLLAKRYPFVKVYALEPDPASYECIRRNVELNHLTNVVVINKALSGDGNKRTLYVNAAKHGTATLDASMAASYPALRVAEVETMTLTQLFDQYGIMRCRLLKINAPGSVRDCLKAFTKDGSVDLLCGEAHLSDCSRGELEAMSWRIARQHFWRTLSLQYPHGTMRSWIHWTPNSMEITPGSMTVTIAD